MVEGTLVITYLIFQSVSNNFRMPTGDTETIIT